MEAAAAFEELTPDTAAGNKNMKDSAALNKLLAPLGLTVGEIYRVRCREISELEKKNMDLRNEVFFANFDEVPGIAAKIRENGVKIALLYRGD